MRGTCKRRPVLYALRLDRMLFRAVADPLDIKDDSMGKMTVDGPKATLEGNDVSSV